MRRNTRIVGPNREAPFRTTHEVSVVTRHSQIKDAGVLRLCLNGVNRDPAVVVRAKLVPDLKLLRGHPASAAHPEWVLRSGSDYATANIQFQ